MIRTPDGHQGTDTDVALLNRMQGTINRWLRRGGHRRRG